MWSSVGLWFCSFAEIVFLAGTLPKIVTFTLGKDLVGPSIAPIHFYQSKGKKSRSYPRKCRNYFSAVIPPDMALSTSSIQTTMFTFRGPVCLLCLALQIFLFFSRRVTHTSRKSGKVLCSCQEVIILIDGTILITGAFTAAANALRIPSAFGGLQ